VDLLVGRARRTRRALVPAALLVAALPAGCGGSDSHGGAPNAGGPLRGLTQRAGIAIGTAVDAGALAGDGGYRTELAREFSSVTPENAMKWAALEPERGKLDWAAADAIVDFAGAHGMRVRGHTLVWYSQNPDWLTGGRFSRAELTGLLRAHIAAVVGRYRGRVGTWDVVNEPMADAGGGLRDSIWSQVIGPDYIAIALRAARAADPQAKLFINETAADGIGPKSDALYALVKGLLADGVPLDGVGFQMHAELAHGLVPEVRPNFRRFATLGLEVNVTEADVAVKLPATAADRRRQAEIYREMVDDCLAVPACRSFTVWGFTDRYSWIPASQPGYGAGTLLDDNLDPKPAYDAVARALRDDAR
jgi:endo-1,4-beta-xylanase